MSRLIAVLLIVGLFIGGCTTATPTAPTQSTVVPSTPTPPAPPPEPPTAPGAYTGLKVDPEKAARRPLAVMIDNSPKARPQHGLKAASVVYEMLAEGGITRYMALFVEGDAGTIGPVRSARHYFVYAAAGHNAVYAHCGGSPQGYSEIQNLKIQNLDDMKDRGVFYRNPDRSSPHNLYTSTKALREAMGTRGWDKPGSVVPPWKHTDEAATGKPATYVSIPYPNGYQGYSVSYEYDAAAGVYKRSAAGEPHVDAQDGKQITAKNVMVLYIKSWPIPNDRDLRIDMNIVGSGKGTLYVDGVQREIKWSKRSKIAEFVFTETSGSTLSLRRGNVWIQVVPLETAVESR